MRKFIVILSAVLALTNMACSTADRLRVKEHTIDPVLFEAGKSSTNIKE
jgi:hypothetical protein